ncbi:polyprenyl synthetase family protein [Glutamicibacter creatinolyticus]|uniref:Polyprenyl synthetase family protein n=1 Tax=Glutamicibacter creatinolyticus TaxID=162496 RepID=A0A5B7WUS3_9MICC|nr:MULTISPECIES: polyprenyl synthetase family protein [Glutamicibacter]QCY47866.1 Polyprenyl synthetase family protein [Glutamicibacter creatinolyticus]TLK50974.1 polyprenyl synthetase family protein [Glutamicibacter sp. V16R2B1]
MTDSKSNWTAAGHEVPNSIELNPETAALAATINLPAGFAPIAEDPEFGPAVSTGLAKVEKLLRDAIANSDPLIDASSRHLVEAGGKRVRPLLVLLTALLGEGIDDDVIKAAAVVELTHLATLYHDDVMDSAPMRRGAPTAHEVWGNSVAILAGDLIFARASVLGAELGPEAVTWQSRTFERLCLGQLHEWIGPREGDDPIAHHLQVISDKTASLLATSGAFGARFGQRPEYVAILREYGEKVGVAFQVADDVIDLVATSGNSGKTPGTDLREEVPTLPVLKLREAAAHGDQDAIAALELVDGDLSSDEALAQAVAAVGAHPATRQAWEVARQWADDAIKVLEPLPEGTVKHALIAFADAVVTREA